MMDHLRDRILHLREALQAGLIERDEPLRLALLAALSGEHLLLIGPPGTAKSELARRLHLAFEDAPYFERLLTRFTVPEEVFGPLSIQELENDRYLRQIEGYLPTASVAFIDEIFKANSAILNSLLTLLNEREFDNGVERIRCPLICIIGASNELPEDEELAALYDRFLLRYHVSPVSDAGFEKLVDLAPPTDLQPSKRLTRKDVEDVQARADAIPLSLAARDLLRNLRAFLREQGMPISDRRWRKIIGLMRMSACTNGDAEVTIWDGWVLPHSTWESVDQQASLEAWFCRQLGTRSAGEPGQLVGVVEAWESELKKLEERRHHRKDKKGRFLFLDDDGNQIPKGELARKRNARGEGLYLVPLEILGGKADDEAVDRTNQGRGMTKEEVQKHFFTWRGNRQESARAFAAYVRDHKNFLTYQGKPLLGPRPVPGDEIDRCVKQVETHLKQIQVHLAGVEKEMASLQDRIEKHLWLPSQMAEDASRAIAENHDHLVEMRDRLLSIRKGYRNLPVEA
jgi:MoxR-like ATPase